STGGRPASALALDDRSGVVLCADLGVTHSRFALCDLGAAPLAEVATDLDIGLGPEVVLSEVERRFSDLLDQAGHRLEEVRGIGLGVPGPVAFDRGEVIRPPIMPGWDGFSVRDWFGQRYEAEVLVDNDVNIMAQGEHWA